MELELALTCELASLEIAPDVTEMEESGLWFWVSVLVEVSYVSPILYIVHSPNSQQNCIKINLFPKESGSKKNNSGFN